MTPWFGGLEVVLRLGNRLPSGSESWVMLAALMTMHVLVRNSQIPKTCLDTGQFATVTV
jgi:hypothetical protein